MQYEQFLSRTQELPFISDKETADAAVKAVAGLFASKLDKAHAAQLADHLPSPLSYERLRGSQDTERMPETAEQSFDGLLDQFGLDSPQGQVLVNTVFGCITESLNEGSLKELCNNLPEDWQALFTIH